MLSASDEKIWSVTELNAIVREILEGSLLPFWVTGEVGNLTIHRSGHVYMTLKDASSQIKTVYFSGAETCRKLGLKEGMQVECFGKLSCYMARGEYQMNIRTLRPVGIGTLQQQFEELKNRLTKEGLFDQACKKAIPFLPKCIGIITSSEGAALHDFLKISLGRFPNLAIKIFPAPVQGKGAEKFLASGIRFFNIHKEVDVIVLTRGGGSLEDLWPFNEEILAREIAASSIPVISAVGHEVDFTIADFAADMRAPTPSGAAEMLVPEKAVLLDKISNLEKRLMQSILFTAQEAKSRLDSLLASPVLEEPAAFVMEKSHYVDDLVSEMENALEKALLDKEKKIQLLEGKLSALSPYNVLQRGYALLTDEKGTPVRSPEDAPKDTLMTAHLAKGRLLVRSEGEKRA